MHTIKTKAKVNFLQDPRSVKEMLEDPANQLKIKVIEDVRRGLRSRDRILADPNEQIFLRKHVALGLPMAYIAWRFGLTEGQAWNVVRELEII